jgi:hypothetical protein
MEGMPSSEGSANYHRGSAVFKERPQLPKGTTLPLLGKSIEGRFCPVGRARVLGLSEGKPGGLELGLQFYPDANLTADMLVEDLSLRSSEQVRDVRWMTVEDAVVEPGLTVDLQTTALFRQLVFSELSASGRFRISPQSPVSKFNERMTEAFYSEAAAGFADIDARQREARGQIISPSAEISIRPVIYRMAITEGPEQSGKSKMARRYSVASRLIFTHLETGKEIYRCSAGAESLEQWDEVQGVFLGERVEQPVDRVHTMLRAGVRSLVDGLGSGKAYKQAGGESSPYASNPVNVSP